MAAWVEVTFALGKAMGIGLFCVCLWLAGTACAEGLAVSARAAATEDTSVVTSVVAGETCLFLPASISPGAVRLFADARGALTITGEPGLSAVFQSGETVDVAALFASPPDDGRYPVAITAQDGRTAAVVLLFSAHIRALFIQSDDPVQQGRAYIDGSTAHETRASGALVLLRADGSVAYRGLLEQIRGRGNTSWGNYPLTSDTVTVVDKKPYQITLAYKADLLDTGVSAEQNKRWVLLADYYDGTMLHNRISFELARELGLTETPHCAPVDLYYDGEYRGQYLLTEKIEVGEGRVEVADYDQILTQRSLAAGQDIASLPQEKGESAAGVPLAATPGVADGGAFYQGGYLIEMDATYYAQDPTYFGLRNGNYYVLHNPQYASPAMVANMAALFEDIDATLIHYGVSPDTGKRWTDFFQTESLLPYYWVNKLAKNLDTWLASSTYFVMPEGGGKLRMGPVWDFDQAYYLLAQDDSGIGDPLTLPATEFSWGYALERIPGFQAMAKPYFLEKLTPLVETVLLGDAQAHGTTLRSLAWYWEETAASRRMNDALWNPVSLFGTAVADTYAENYLNLRSFLRERLDWLKEDVERWPATQPTAEIGVQLKAPYANVEGQLAATLNDLHTNVQQPAVTLTQFREATETRYAVWQVEITVAPKPGTVIAQDAVLRVNGTVVPYTRNTDGSVMARVWFDDPSYRPAVYEDTDYGLVFDAAYYAARYPEVVAAVGEDARALLAYYVEEGMAQGQMANAFFDPEEVLRQVPDLAVLLADDDAAVAAYFMEVGYEDLMATLERYFAPTVRSSEG